MKSGIKEFVPFSKDDPALFTDLPESVQEQVRSWIRFNLVPRQTVNRWHSSYGLKHYLQSDTGIYMTNNQFKQAMGLCGYLPDDASELNWKYRISELSPCFQKAKKGNVMA